jgi:hypothetical protein
MLEKNCPIAPSLVETAIEHRLVLSTSLAERLLSASGYVMVEWGFGGSCMRTFIWLGIALLSATDAMAQSFSCSMGRPSCVDYSDKIVRRDAQCFDSYTCFPGGFVCKSDMDELSEKARRIAQGYDDLRQCLSRASDMSGVASCVSRDNLNSFR